jgi:hypothetical protein
LAQRLSESRQTMEPDQHGAVDDKGRTALSLMTDAEKITELLAIGRATQDLVERFVEDFSSGKMGGMLGMMGKLMGGNK